MIKNMYQRLHLLAVFFTASCLLGAASATPLQVFRCPSESSLFEINACPLKCESSSQSYVEFMVNDKTRSVLEAWKLSKPIEINGKMLPRGHVTSSELHENCTIFDKQNWDCSMKENPLDEPEVGIYMASGATKRMVNGVYRSYLWVETSKTNYWQRSKKYLSGGCMAPFNY
jgi:hypothetical protein